MDSAPGGPACQEGEMSAKKPAKLREIVGIREEKLRARLAFSAVDSCFVIMTALPSGAIV
jgi:hypothetical protein